MSTGPVLSRRSAFSAVGAAAAGCALSRAARAQDYHPQSQSKITQAAAHYQGSPRGDESCGSCPYFIVPKSCVTVSGDIDPNGWCQMYTRFSPLDRGAHSAGQ